MPDEMRAARERMERAANQSRRTFGEGDPEGKPLPKRPQRYRLYDKIKGRVSVGAMNVIIGATVLLLIVALIVGIATGNPR